MYRGGLLIKFFLKFLLEDKFRYNVSILLALWTFKTFIVWLYAVCSTVKNDSAVMVSYFDAYGHFFTKKRVQNAY